MFIIKSSLALEEEEEICVEVDATLEDMAHAIIVKIVQIKVTTFKPQTQDFQQIPIAIRKHRQCNKTTKLVTKSYYRYEDSNVEENTHEALGSQCK